MNNNFKKFVDKLKRKERLYRTKVELKEHPIKGMGLFARDKFKKGDIIAYYKVTVYDADKYISPTHNVYTFHIYRKNGAYIKKYIGDIDKSSFPNPVNGISFLGPFANEPSVGETSNAEVDLNLDENYSDRRWLRAGDTVIYNVIAIKTIKKGDEILWYYGDDYLRNYEVNEKN